MGFTCGIVGLPNVGKSTIFNALTSAKAASENFPFCTIEPNTGVVPVPDSRIHLLSEMAKSAKVIPTQMTFVDIAGLIRGAASGEGLGNQFLGHIRSVDAIAHVVRCFENDNIIHVEGSIDPLRDIETIDTELILSDLESVQKQITKYQKMGKSGDKDAKLCLDYLAKLESHLSEGNAARTFEEELREDLKRPLTQGLLTRKPMLFVANVSEDDVGIAPDLEGSRPVDLVARYAIERGSEVVVICGQIEAELAELSHEERKEYLSELGLELSGLDRLILAGYRLLNLITFFTVGPKETRAWTVQEGASAPECAGKIHSDFQRGFIRAEVIGFDDFVAAGSEQKVKEAGKLRVEGKEYIARDGDIMHFRFNV